MKLAGFARNSFVDYPGRIACVAFAAGCNYDCFFCHNRAIISPDAKIISIDAVLEFLEKRKGLLDAVVISGGEPTLQDELPGFARTVKSMGYLCKLDTNGSNPDAVKHLLQENLLDYVSLDIKAPGEQYPLYCGEADFSAVLQTLDLLRQSAVEHECRTTFLPQLTIEDIARMASSIAPFKRYALQAYRVPPVYKPTDRFRVSAAPHSPEDMKRAAAAARECGGEVIVRA